jgi:hypothetical protein
MAAFEGAADPQKAVNSGFYIQQPRNPVADRIAARIALRPASTHLLIGGIGSGKTTQLLVTCDRIKEIEDISAHYVDVSLYTDISKIEPGVLLAIAGLVLSEIMDDIENPKIINLIHKYAHGYKEEKVEREPIMAEGIFSLGLGRIKNTTIIEKEGLLTAKFLINKDLKDFEEAVINLHKKAREKYGEIIFLFDGLDRLTDAANFAQLVTTDIPAMSQIGIGLVLVGPLVAAYSSYRDTLEQAANYSYYQSCFDVENDTEALTFFENILRARSAKSFIEESAIQMLI